MSATTFQHCDPSFNRPHSCSRCGLLGYVNGIGSLGPSPKYRLMGGTMTIIGGPIDPMTTDQKIAGFSCDAQRM